MHWLAQKIACSSQVRMYLQNYEMHHKIVNIADGYTALQKRINEFEKHVLEAYNRIKMLRHELSTYSNDVDTQINSFNKYQRYV